MRIAIVVQGRFHAFDLARGLLARGHDVTVFTNYPRWAARRFGLAPDRVRSFPLHGVLSRAVERCGVQALQRWWEPVGHRLFGRWAARELAREQWDVIHCWSGVSEEILTAPAARDAQTLLMRGSSHIATQRKLLEDERVRVGTPLDLPSEWMVNRELHEYGMADRIVVLSSFSARTFTEQGVPLSRISVLPLGVQVEAFEPSAGVLERRVARIRRGDPLTILFVGTLSYQKGLWDLVAAAKAVGVERFRFLLVGGILPEAHKLLSTLDAGVIVTGRVPQTELPDLYSRGDLFLFPTIQDGFGVVLAQARAARLPIVTTPNSAGSDIVEPDRDGWIVPIRDANAIVERLRWCDANRSALADMIEQGQRRRSRDWVEVAADFERICAEAAGRVLAGEHGMSQSPTAILA